MLNAKRRTWLRFADRGPRTGVPLCSGASTILPTVKHLFEKRLDSSEPFVLQFRKQRHRVSQRARDERECERSPARP
jgi:hypothetical protein